MYYFAGDERGVATIWGREKLPCVTLHTLHYHLSIYLNSRSAFKPKSADFFQEITDMAVVCMPQKADNGGLMRHSASMG